VLGRQLARRAQHDAIKERKVAGGGEKIGGALVLSCHDDFGCPQA
jgi:hypothetical protein